MSFIVRFYGENVTSLTGNVLACWCCTDILGLRFKLAAADPVAYYNILESACRVAVRGNESSNSSWSNNSGPRSSSSSSKGQDHIIGKLGGKKSRGSSSVCKAESEAGCKAPKGRGRKGARTGANNSSSSNSRAESIGERNVSMIIFRQAGKLLDTWGVSDKSGDQPILRTWQHYKAYLSAHASWNKASIKLLLLLVERGIEFGLTETEEYELAQNMDLLSDSGPDEGVKALEHADAAEAVDGSLGGRQQQQQQMGQAQHQQGGQAQQEEEGGAGTAYRGAAKAVRAAPAAANWLG